MDNWPMKYDGPCACRFVRRDEFCVCEQVEWCGLHARQRDELERLRTAPIAIMDTRDILGICAPAEDDFPALYALQGKRVRLVLDEVTPNVEVTGGALRRPG